MFSLLAFLAFYPGVSVPWHKLPLMLVIWKEPRLKNDEASLMLNRVFLKCFGEILDSRVSWAPTFCNRCQKGHVPKTKVCLAYDACAALGSLSFSAVIAKLV